MTQDILRTNLCFRRYHIQELSFFTISAVQRQHILLHIIMISTVNIPVHMNGKAWNHHKISVNVYKLLQDLAVFAHDHSACHRKRTVKPGGKDHSTVPFHIQLHISSTYRHLRIFLDLKGRGITVTRNNMVSSGIIHWNGKSDDRRMISHDKIFSAFFQLPVFFLFQFCKAFFQKTFSYCFCRMKSSWTAADKFQKFLCCLFVHVCFLL